MFSVYFLHFTK